MRQHIGLVGSVLSGVIFLMGCQSGTPSNTATAPPPQSAEPSRSASGSVNPGINDNYLDPDLNVQEWVGRFEREDREVYKNREAIIEAIGLKPGMDVADIGAGTGAFTFPMAKEVGEDGLVFAVDIAESFLELIQQRADEAGSDNVITVFGTETSVELPPSSIDLAFISDTYHHFEYPSRTLASLHQALREGGQIFMVEFHRIPGTSSQWAMDHVRAGQEVFTREIEQAGFEKVEEITGLLEENYILRFRKK